MTSFTFAGTIFIVATLLGLLLFVMNTRVQFGALSLLMGLTSSIYTYSLPIAAWIVLIFGAARPFTTIKAIVNFRPAFIVGLLGCEQLLSAIWSPEPALAVTAMANTLTFSIAFALAHNSGLTQERKATVLALALAPVALLASVSTIIFRLTPDLERSYYDSPVASFLLGNLVNGLYTVPANMNNTIDANRAAGVFFVNVNRDAVTLGVLTIAFVICYCYARRSVLLLLSALCATAVALTGSKTGLSLLVVLPVFALMLSRVAQARSAAASVGILVGGLVALGGALVYVSIYASAFVDASALTLVPRLRLWTQALQEIRASPLAGLGFGGWELHWEYAGATSLAHLRFPPHNWVLADWLDGGVSAVILEVASLVVIFAWAWRRVRNASSAAERQAAAFLVAAFSWVAIHGLGDNTSFLGTPLTIVALGTLCSVVAGPGPHLPTTDGQLGLSSNVTRVRGSTS